MKWLRVFRQLRLRPIVIHVAIGVVVTVAVSWGVRHTHFANAYPGSWMTMRSHYIESHGRRWDIWVESGMGRSFYRVTPVDPFQLRLFQLQEEKKDLRRRQREVEAKILAQRAGTSDPDRFDFSMVIPFYEPNWKKQEGEVPAWVVVPRHGSGVEMMITTGYGWPMPALQEQIRNPYGPGAEGLWIWSPGEREGRGISLVRPLRKPLEFGFPTRPIWTGLAIDVAFYGLLSWLPFFLRGWVRRAHRRRRGLCLGCGYDCGGLPASQVCPECGGTAG